ncbi:MAG: AfsR/SARP family transcriptional regulator [Planctomycetota bacterium]
MLKAIVALGGKDIIEFRISDILWPMANNDAAHHAFTTTLSRLRQLIGIDKAILLQDGLITLNAQYCWVDVWSFKKQLDLAENAAKNGQKEEHIQFLVNAVEVYRGDFLESDIEQLWTVSLRERLRNKFIRSIIKLGNHLEGTKEFEKAICCYSKGLEVSDLAEELYQRLMVCYYRLGNNADIVGVYERLKKVLSAASGITPSAKMEQIFKNLLDK